MKPFGKRAILIAIRGPSGRLYGYLNPETLTIQVKQKGKPPEVIDLAAYLRERPPKD